MGRIWLKVDGWNVERTHAKDPAGVEYVVSSHYEELLEWAQEFAAQYACGCNHPACKNCQRDTGIQEAIDKIKQFHDRGAK